jgi:nitrilase
MAQPVVTVAAVQATPVVLDLEASVEKACRLIGEAAAQGAQLAVLPECFLSIYPTRLWAGGMVSDPDTGDEVWRRFWDSSVEVPGPHVDRLIEACREHEIRVVIGVNEREPDRPAGTVYNAWLLLGPEGLLFKHRKLMPTFHERLFHGIGDGNDLAVTATPAGRIGGLICWEHRMPLARYAVYRGGPQIWAAPTADTTDGWQALMRTIAIEAGAFVVAVAQYVPRAAYPDDFPLPLPDREVLSEGNSCIVDPAGDIIAGPLADAEGILLAECDLERCAIEKQWFDVTGHYGREDVLVPLLTRPDG